jgi:dCMP deaminase
MNKQLRYDTAYLRLATEWSKLSWAKRKQVGSLLVKDGVIISDGYNGTPTGFENECEDGNGDTKWYVIHAEANAILKCSKYGNSCDGSTLYITHSPCRDCSRLILQTGIKRVVYINDYKDPSGKEFLIKAGIPVEQINI